MRTIPFTTEKTYTKYKCCLISRNGATKIVYNPDEMLTSASISMPSVLSTNNLLASFLQTPSGAFTCDGWMNASEHG